MSQFPAHFKLLLIVVISSFLSCMSTKKHLEQVDILKANHKSELEKRDSELDVAMAKNERLNLQLAERQGEINMLWNLRQELYDTIAMLEQSLIEMGSFSAKCASNALAIP